MLYQPIDQEVPLLELTMKNPLYAGDNVFRQRWKHQAIMLVNFSKKMHENEKKFGLRGGTLPWRPWIRQCLWSHKKNFDPKTYIRLQHDVTNSYSVLREFSTSQKELLLVSSRSISSLISGWGRDSNYSWMLVHALCLLWMGGVLGCNTGRCLRGVHVNSSFFSVLPMILPCNTHAGKKTNPQLKYSLYWLLLRLVVHSWISIQDTQWEFSNIGQPPSITVKK